MKNIHIKKQHSENCFFLKEMMKVKLCPDFKKPVFFGNFAGNERSGIIGGSRLWYRVRCNSPECEYSAVVNFDELEKLILHLVYAKK